MDIEKLQKEVTDKKAIIDDARDFINKTNQSIAEHCCPYAVGDKVLNTDGVEEFIASIGYRSVRPFYDFKVFKIKKDGNPHKYSCHAWHPEHYKAAVQSNV